MRSDSDDELVRYLLGDLPPAEAERLDERSVTDDEFALRLRELENDLVDRYARGEAFDVSLEQFDRLHRGSSHLRDKVQFAQALHALTSTAAADGRVAPAPATGALASASNRLAWQSLAAAAVVALAAAGYLGIRNLQLGDELRQLDTRRVALERQHAELQRELEQARATPAPGRAPITATFLLPAPRRGIPTEATTISLPRGADQVTWHLQVESDAYSIFWAALRDLATSRIVWRSGDLAAETSGSDRVVTVAIPASALVNERYAIELSAIDSRGSAELVGHYVVRLVLE